jgi:hypothetical protein
VIDIVLTGKIGARFQRVYAGFTFHTKGLKPFKQFPVQNLIIPEVRLKSICLKELNCYNATMFSKG